MTADSVFIWSYVELELEAFLLSIRSIELEGMSRLMITRAACCRGWERVSDLQMKVKVEPHA